MGNLHSAISYAERRSWTPQEAESLEKNFGVSRASYASIMVGIANLLFQLWGTRYEERIALAAYSGYLVLTASIFYFLRHRAYSRYLSNMTAGNGDDDAARGAARIAAAHAVGGQASAGGVASLVGARRSLASNAIEMIVMGEDSVRESTALLEAGHIAGDESARQRVVNFLKIYNNDQADLQMYFKDLMVQWMFMALLYVINAAATGETVYYRKAESNFTTGLLALAFPLCCSCFQPNFYTNTDLEAAFKSQNTVLNSAKNFVRFLLWAPTETIKAVANCVARRPLQS